MDGRLTLNFRPTTSPPFMNPYYNPDRYNLVILWDVLMQEYRAINMSFCNLIAKVPARKQEFWDYFNKEIYPKSMAQKKSWMDM